MTTFRIDAENNITAFASEQIEESGGETEIFTNQQELAHAAGKWAAARLVTIWNSLPGAEPVQRVTSRQVAVTRILKAIQGLAPADASEQPVAGQKITSRQEAPAARKQAPGHTTAS